jgi:hypothetical protein
MSEFSEPLIVYTSSATRWIRVNWFTAALALAAFAIVLTTWPREAGAAPDALIVTEVESEAGEPTAVPRGQSKSIDAALARIRAMGDEISRLEQRLDGVEGLALKALEARLARYWNESIRLIQSTARDVLKLAKAGHDVRTYIETISNSLNSAPAAILAEIDRVGGKITLPKDGQSAAEQSAIDADASLAVDRLITLYRALLVKHRT